jgi:hypothetical protein
LYNGGWTEIICLFVIGLGEELVEDKHRNTKYFDKVVAKTETRVLKKCFIEYIAL